ncbi:MAG: hypothetical protein QG664_840, partial [Patescibacteria group bacterium]|nr:hypothetical protein [Patescibacteria group bacterium]
TGAEAARNIGECLTIILRENTK